jgi:uncharacterized protein (DUF1015 family)
MATIRPFRALRPAPENAARTAAVPYDVVTTAEARELAAGNPLSFLHVSRPEIDLPDGTDPYSDVVYQKAADNFEALKRECPFIVEAAPIVYVYQLRMGSHRQTGIAACCSIDEYDSDVIRKHERTRKDKEDDRTRHMIALRAQTGPVFLTYRPRAEIDTLIDGATARDPLYDFIAPDQIQHTVWRADEGMTQHIVSAFASVPAIYIADGHHRAASAARARAQLRSEIPGHKGDEPYNFFLAVLFPSDQVQILPYNRVVKDLNGMWPDEFLSVLSRHFKVTENSQRTPPQKGEIGLYLDGRWRTAAIPPETIPKDDPIRSLDVSLLQERVLESLLGIKDVRTDKRIDFIGGVKGPETLKRLVDQGQAAVAFSLFPVTVGELIAVSDAGQIMPPKSTWFEPKLRDGLLIHRI